MRKLKVTQTQAIFYKLWLQRKADATKFTPVFELMGEVYVKEHFGIWAYVSYEVSSRLSDLVKRNPTLLEIKKVVGRSGARYNAYRLHLEVTKDDIRDPDLLEFYNKIKSAPRP